MKRKAGRKKQPLELPVWRVFRSYCTGGPPTWKCSVVMERMTLDRSVVGMPDTCPDCNRKRRLQWAEWFGAEEFWVHATIEHARDAEDRCIEMIRADRSREYSIWKLENGWELCSVPSLKEKANAT